MTWGGMEYIWFGCLGLGQVRPKPDISLLACSDERRKKDGCKCLFWDFFLPGIGGRTFIKAKYSETNKEAVLAHVVTYTLHCFIYPDFGEFGYKFSILLSFCL